MTKKEKEIVDELISMSSFYNFWDIDSMRMALGNIKETLKKLKKNEKKAWLVYVKFRNVMYEFNERNKRNDNWRFKW